MDGVDNESRIRRLESENYREALCLLGFSIIK